LRQFNALQVKQMLGGRANARKGKEMLYTFDNALFDDKEYAFSDPINPKYGSAQICNTCGKYISQATWENPRVVKFSKNKIGDFLFGSCFPFLLNKKTYDLLNNKIKGIIEFKGVIDKNNTEYYLPELEICPAEIDEQEC